MTLSFLAYDQAVVVQHVPLSSMHMLTLPTGRSQVGFFELLTFLVKAYSSDHRIAYGTEQITTSEAVAQYAKDLFDRDCVAFVDLRSAENNFFLTRIIRSQ